MASQGQVVFWSMTVVTLILAAVIALIIGFGVSAFSTPKAQMEKSSRGHTLQCGAPPCFPHSDAGENLPHSANTSYQMGADSITLKVVSFLHNMPAHATYTCVIENRIAKATGNIQVPGFSVPREINLQLVNLNAESMSSSLPTCHWMLLLPLCLLLT